MDNSLLALTADGSLPDRSPIYHIQDPVELGKGGDGIVYEGYCEELGKIIVYKEPKLPENWTADQLRRAADRLRKVAQFLDICIEVHQAVYLYTRPAGNIILVRCEMQLKNVDSDTYRHWVRCS